MTASAGMVTRGNEQPRQEAPPSALLDYAPATIAARDVLQHAIAAGRTDLSERDSKALSPGYGVPTASTYFAPAADAAMRLAREIGYPVALKIVSPHVADHADVGGVMLNLENDDEVRRAALAISERLEQFRPGATLAGFTVQRMMRKPAAVHAPARSPGSSGPAVRSYPSELEEMLELGTERFLLRAIRPEDGPAYADFISRIAEPDLRLRFVRHKDAWSHRDLVRYTQIDYDREMAFVAVRQSGSAAGEIVGEVRAYRYPEGITAEAAIIVRSDMKRRGLGRALMDKMIRYCKANGLGLIARILPENTAMRRLSERCGMEVEHRPGSDFAIAHI
jgi:RimJ/RimL family protein N-acetyltransferase